MVVRSDGISDLDWADQFGLGLGGDDDWRVVSGGQPHNYYYAVTFKSEADSELQRGSRALVNLLRSFIKTGVAVDERMAVVAVKVEENQLKDFERLIRSAKARDLEFPLFNPPLR